MQDYLYSVIGFIAIVEIPTQSDPLCVIRDYNFGQFLNRPQNATI